MNDDRTRKMRSGRPRRWNLGDIFAFVILTTGLFVILLPFVWLASTALKTQVDALALPPIFPFTPTFEHVDFLTSSFLQYEINSVVITTLATTVALVLGVPAGYALSVSGSRRSTRFLALWMLATFMVPGVAFIVPLFLIFHQLGLTNTYLGIVLGYQTGLIPFTIWLSRSYFLDVPPELDDAARVDGCSRFQAFYRIILPVSISGVATVGILVAIFSWGEYFGTLILGGSSTFTATVGLTNFLGQYGTDLPRLAMASLVIVLPILLATVVAQRGLLRGVTGGAIKG